MIRAAPSPFGVHAVAIARGSARRARGFGVGAGAGVVGAYVFGVHPHQPDAAARGAFLQLQHHNVAVVVGVTCFRGAARWDGGASALRLGLVLLLW